MPIIFIDLDHRIIPNKITAPAAVIGIVLVLVFELPPAALASGLPLLLPTGSGEDARIPLQ